MARVFLFFFGLSRSPVRFLTMALDYIVVISCYSVLVYYSTNLNEHLSLPTKSKF